MGESSVVKSYNGTAPPFLDDTITEFSVLPGFYYYTACLYDAGNRIMYRQVSNEVSFGAANYQTLLTTSVFYDSNFNGVTGLIGADALCQLHGSKINNTKWKALLSTSVESASSRLSVFYPILNTRGMHVALDHADLFDGSKGSFIFNELIVKQSVSAWTGSTNFGLHSSSCSNWNSGAGSAAIGYPAVSLNTSWINSGNAVCSGKSLLICLDQQP